MDDFPIRLVDGKPARFSAYRGYVGGGSYATTVCYWFLDDPDTPHYLSEAAFDARSEAAPEFDTVLLFVAA